MVYIKSIFSLYVEIWGKKLKKFFKWPKTGLKWNCKKVRFFQSYSEFSKLSNTKQFVTQFSKVRKTNSACIFFKIEKNWKFFKTTLKIGLKYFDRKNPISSNWIRFVWQKYYQYVYKDILVNLKCIFSLYVQIWGKKLKKFFKWPKIGLKWNCKRSAFFSKL